MTTKALTAALLVQPVSTASLTAIPYGLILADANRFGCRDGDAVVHVIQLATQRREMVRVRVRTSDFLPFLDRVRADCIA